MEILEQFGIQPILLAAQVVNFLILLFILRKFLYGPILKVLDERKRKIADSLKNAEEIEKKLQEVEVQADKILRKALDESQKILDEAKEVATQIVEDGQKTATQIMNRAHEDSLKVIQVEKVQLIQEIREHAADLVALIFEKLVGKKISSKDQKEIIEKTVKRIS